jgi:hypothetical protein
VKPKAYRRRRFPARYRRGDAELLAGVDEAHEIERAPTYTDEKGGAVRHVKLNASTLETIHTATAERLAAFDIKFNEEESRRLEHGFPAPERAKELSCREIDVLGITRVEHHFLGLALGVVDAEIIAELSGTGQA